MFSLVDYFSNVKDFHTVMCKFSASLNSVSSITAKLRCDKLYSLLFNQITASIIELELNYLARIAKLMLEK